ncbi:uncharacterized protein LOC122304632 [Carya illinoinensis]|uniref:uncharacterized protein LOC122304632 n=1 Tax=Carya illinoinensis TaxID=32201 RepID=UPI001C71B237|nr:uncharacterized protein LOC122304632 [Carya illinoinensis]
MYAGVNHSAKDLEELWKNLKLTEEEEEVVEIEGCGNEDIRRKDELSLIGRVCSDRVIGKDLISNTMARIWRIGKKASFQEVGKNTYVITFGTHADLQRVLEGKPWFFDNAMFLLMLYDGKMKPGKIAFDSEVFWMQIHNLPLSCMSEEWGNRIGKTVGKVVDVDTQEDGTGWGRWLRVKVEIKLRKQIARGRFISVQNAKHWVLFRYESLPKICFQCSWLLHDDQGCQASKENQREEDPDGKPQFSPWLRAEMAPRRWSGQARYPSDMGAREK